MIWRQDIEKAIAKYEDMIPTEVFNCLTDALAELERLTVEVDKWRAREKAARSMIPVDTGSPTKNDRAAELEKDIDVVIKTMRYP